MNEEQYLQFILRQSTGQPTTEEERTAAMAYISRTEEGGDFFSNLSGMDYSKMPYDLPPSGDNYYTDNMPNMAGESLFGVQAPLRAQVTRPGYVTGTSNLIGQPARGNPTNPDGTPNRGFETGRIYTEAIPPKRDPNAPFIVEDRFMDNRSYGTDTGTDAKVASYAPDGSPIYAGTTAGGKPRGNPWDLGRNNLPMMYPGGSDINTQLFSAGRGIGMESGTKGRAGLIVGGLGAAALGTTRNLLAGIGYEKQQNYVRDWYMQRQRDKDYEAVSETGNTNTVGGPSVNKYGGVHKTYEEGGEMPQEQMMSQEQMPQDQMPQEGQEVIQQIQQAIVGMLQQGAQPEQVVQELVSQGIPQEQATAMVQEVLMQMQGAQQQPPQEMMPEGFTPPEQMMKLGGKKIGDNVSFKYGGKMHKGKIKKIENGKIYI